MTKFRVLILGLVLMALMLEAVLLLNHKTDGQVQLTEQERLYLQSVAPIKMAVDPDWKPYETIDAKGNYAGIAADYVKLLAQKLDVDFVLVPTKDWRESIEFSKAGKVTVLPLLNRSAEREKWLTFSEPLIIDDNVIIGRNDSPVITNLKEVANKTVVLPEGTSVEERLRVDYPNLNIVLTSSEESAFEMVLSKKADFTIRSLIVSEYNIRRAGWFELKVIGKLNGYTNYLSMGIIQSEAGLKPILDKAILSITEQERTDILNRHVPLRVEIRDYRSAILYALWATLAIIMVILIGFGFVFYRNKQLEKFNREMQVITNRYEALSALAKTYFWEIDAAGIVTYVSPEVTKVTGFSVAEMIGRHFSECLPELSQYLETTRIDVEQTVIAAEIRHRVKGQPAIWVKVDAMALKDQKDAIVGYSGSCTDIVRRKELERKLIEAKSEAELAYYQAQITPHFLYNAMSAIALYCLTEPKKASQLIMDLSYFLKTRFDFKGTNQMVTLSQELDLIKAYLNIEKARFQERLNVTYEIDESLLKQKIPPLILQPLVENAINHGIMKRIVGGHILISVFRQEDRVCLEIQDDGVGISADVSASILQFSSAIGDHAEDKLTEAPHKGVGLANIQERLMRLYNSPLNINLNKSGGTTVSFSLPLKLDRETG